MSAVPGIVAGMGSLGRMHETDLTDEPDPVGDDPELDGFETALDDVAAALDALDADDLDTAERLSAGLDTPPAGGLDTSSTDDAGPTEVQ